MTYLISIAIGPVQEFIATARRSRDLWFGSWLLSELSKAAAKAITEQPGCTVDSLIFPRITAEKKDDLNPNTEFNVVNKLLASIETHDPASFGKLIKEAVDARLQTIRDQAWQRLRGNKYFDKDNAERQVVDLIEFFWAAVPYDPSKPTCYKTARDRVEALLAARKTTRNFNCVGDWGKAGVPKSSLDGLRESVIDEAIYDAVRQKKMTEMELWRRFEVRPGERLCGVGLLKRLGNRSGDDGFMSTSHVASLPLLQRLSEREFVIDFIRELTRQLGIIDENEHELRAFLGKVPKNAHHPVFELYDGRLLFEDRLREFFEEKDKRSQAQKALRDFLDQAFGKGLRPIPYYALLLADGDRMGKAIEAITDIDRHRQLSEKLSEFAGSACVQAIVSAHQGSLVYAGGDDVLAFVPLHHVLDCAQVLNREFNHRLAEFTFNGDKGRDVQPTLSVGIAIAHHLDPLSDTLDLARAAEKEAKKLPGKNALCIKVSKRGGAVTTVIGKWGNLDERLRWFIELHRADEVPDGAAYELRQLATDFKHFSPKNKKDAVAKEVERILKRKRAQHGGKILEADVSKKLKENLAALNAVSADGKNDPLRQLADELIVARELAKAMNQAEPKTNKGEEQ